MNFVNKKTKDNIKISISILTYNRADILCELLTSLELLTYPALEIIVIDNNSTDDTQSLVRDKFPKIEYFRNSKNEGVGARNIGLSKGSGDIIVTLDDDIIGITDSDINSLIELFEDKPDVGAICFKVVDYNSGEVCNWCHHYIQSKFCNREFITDEITEGAVAFRKTALEKSGYYPSFFFISYEGVDLLYRLLNKGYKTIYSPLICVRHRTHQSGRPNWRRYYYDTRNQIWFVIRNLPCLSGLKYLFRGLSAMLIYSVRDGFFKYWLKGVWDGFKNIKKITKKREKATSESMLILKKISQNRPGLLYTFKNRVLKKGIKL